MDYDSEEEKVMSADEYKSEDEPTETIDPTAPIWAAPSSGWRADDKMTLEVDIDPTSDTNPDCIADLINKYFNILLNQV